VGRCIARGRVVKGVGDALLIVMLSSKIWIQIASVFGTGIDSVRRGSRK
jgi:hypothetical protein